LVTLPPKPCIEYGLFPLSNGTGALINGWVVDFAGYRLDVHRRCLALRHGFAVDREKLVELEVEAQRDPEQTLRVLP
jgi:hypothetical protein